METEPTTSDLDRLSVDANGLSFECLHAGDGDRLALCLHGFPDDAGSMAPIARRLADAGFTAVAPYMRGYAPTDPAPDDDYSALSLGLDVLALADALGDEFDTDDAVLVGHDWGAVAAYTAAQSNPEAFTRMATLAVPPGFEALLTDYPKQALRSWYMWFFQLPGTPEHALRWRDFTLVEFLWGLWSPDWDYPEERIEAVKDTLRTDDTAAHAIQYYRDTIGPQVSQMIRGNPTTRDEVAPITTPTLVICGTNDGCIGEELFAEADDFIEDCDILRVRDAGHFMHQERPEVVGREIVEYLS